MVLHLDGYDAPQNISGLNYWVDKSGLSNNGKLLNMAMTNTSGYNSDKKAYSFDGNNDEIDVPNFYTNLNGSFSVTIVFDYHSDGVGDVSLATEGSSAINTQLHLVLRNKKPYFGFWGNDLSSGTNINPNNSISLTFTYDDTTLEKKIYINDKFDIRQINSAALNLADYPLIIGIYSTPLSGDINSVKIYNRALSQTKITQNYNIDKIRFGL